MVERLLAPSDSAVSVEEFGSWMQAEQRRIFLLCRGLLQDADEADMATQDTFLKAYRALQRSLGQPVEDPDKWLTRIAVNTCVDRLRSRAWKFWRRRSKAAEEETVMAKTAVAGPTAEDEIYGQQIGARLAAALGRLSARQKAVFCLRHHEDRSLEEIAEILRLDVGTVKAHMARAVAKLRLELKDLYGLGKTHD